MLPFIQIKSKVIKKAGHPYLPSDSGQKILWKRQIETKEKIDIIR